MRLKSSPEYREAATSSWLERDRSAYVGGLLSGSILVIVLRLEQRIRVREAFVSLTRLRGCGASRSFGSFGQLTLRCSCIRCGPDRLSPGREDGVPSQLPCLVKENLPDGFSCGQ